jgi:hypothetical protein
VQYRRTAVGMYSSTKGNHAFCVSALAFLLAKESRDGERHERRSDGSMCIGFDDC